MDKKKTVVVDGQEYVSVDLMIEEMVRECVIWTDVNDIEVGEIERYRISAYQILLEDMQKVSFPGLQKKFKDMYIKERFIERTLGV